MRRKIKIGLLFFTVSIFFGGGVSQAEIGLEAKALAFAENLKNGDRVDKIRLLGMLELPDVTVDGLRFSQLSGLAWDDDAGVLYVLSDKGFLFHLKPTIQNGTLTNARLLKAVPLRAALGEKLRTGRIDSEGLDILKGHNGRQGDSELVISFERFPRIARYRPDGQAIGEYPLPAPLKDVKAYRDSNKMLESMCVDAKLGVLTVPEASLKTEQKGYTRLFGLDGKSWLYPLPEGHRISAIECLGNNRVMVLESNYWRIFNRLTVSLKVATLPSKPSPSTPVPVATIATLDNNQGHQIDNFEGLTRHRGNRFFMISDNNDLFVQRTLLLYFEVLGDK